MQKEKEPPSLYHSLSWGDFQRAMERELPTEALEQPLLVGTKWGFLALAAVLPRLTGRVCCSLVAA
jgi:hypothetical protein